MLFRTSSLRGCVHWHISVDRPTRMNTVRIWLCDCAAVLLCFYFSCFTMSLLSDQGIEKLVDEMEKR
jgi:hypothetical protein